MSQTACLIPSLAPAANFQAENHQLSFTGKQPQLRQSCTVMQCPLIVFIGHINTATCTIADTDTQPTNGTLFLFEIYIWSFGLGKLSKKPVELSSY